jgi:hypothetical protein
MHHLFSAPARYQFTAMLLLCFAAVFSDKCPASRTLPITQLTEVLWQGRHSFRSAGEVYCLNVTVPRAALSFVEIPDALIEVWRNDERWSLALVANGSLSSSQPGSIDFGDDTDIIAFTAFTKTVLAFSLVRFPERMPESNYI